MQRLSSVELFRLYDKIEGLNTQVSADYEQVKEKNEKILELKLEVNQLTRQV